MRETVTPLMNRVLQVLSCESVHLTAEEILGKVDDVGRATVYRALDRLCEEGLINRLSLEGGTSVYEYVREPHMHFMCRQCGRICDISGDPAAILEQTMRKSVHIVQKMDVTVYGICRDCQLAVNNENGG
ncbi:MAG: transcriptional repressor [Clostridia bacterium]|nr:transcriptional repressor [Clostridia bacterium]